MFKPKIIAHCLVRNEEVWIWYAIMSVLDFVDEVMVWDTGSKDSTADIIRSIRHAKVKFKSIGETPDETSLSQARQEMVDQSSGFDWLMVLDGDEVWLDDSLNKITSFLRENYHKYDIIVTPTLNCVGDVFHISDPTTGRYRLAGRVGHYNLRFINLKVPGLHVANPPGQLQSYYDGFQIKLQDRDPHRIAYLDTPYLHMTHLTRSLDRRNETAVFWRAVKKKYELGISLPVDFSYPKCFYYPFPAPARSAFVKRDLVYLARALWQTPLQKFKRLFLDKMIFN